MSFQLPLDYCCEIYFKMLVDKGLLHVCNPPLGGSDGHYSLVDGSWQEPCVPGSIRDQVLYSYIHPKML